MKCWFDIAAFCFHLQIDLLQEITQSPRIFSEVDAALKAKQMKADLDEYLKVICSYLAFVSFPSFKILSQNLFHSQILTLFFFFGKVYYFLYHDSLFFALFNS